jgi:Kdo2-lipid IVA lauroyltransferase/acyltransferase
VKVNISTFFQSPINIFLFRRMSPRVAKAYLQGIGVLYYLFKRREKRLIEKNVRDLLVGREEKYVRMVVRETFRGIFTHYFEKMFSAFLDFPVVKRYVQEHFELQGGELLKTALAQGKGCVLVTAHWGAVEFIPWVLHVHGFPTSVILECATSRLAKGLLKQSQDHNMQLITSAHGGSIFLRAMTALKENRVLMTQCDEVDAWRKRKGHTIRLFGRDLFFDNTIDVLSHRSGAPVICAFLKRAGAGRYTLILEDVSVLRKPESSARDVLELWQKYVSLYPEQWYQWKKWKEFKAA